jgi:hypothetical protein
MANRYKIVVTVEGHDSPAEAVIDAAAELGHALAGEGITVTVSVDDTFDQSVLLISHP